MPDDTWTVRGGGVVADPRALLDAYASTPTSIEYGDTKEYGFTPEETAPKVFAAVEAVLGLHQPFTVTDSTWNPKPVGCDHCSKVPDFVDWPCPTVQAVITALEEDRG